MSPIEAGLARLRTPSPEDRWEEGWPEPKFARDLVAALLSEPDGERILGFVVVAVARAMLLVWRAYEDPGQLLATVTAIDGWLDCGHPRAACLPFGTPAITYYRDCTQGRLLMAADSAAAAARFVASSDGAEALTAIRAAFEAFNEIGCCDAFLVWLADDVFPAALTLTAPAHIFRFST